MENSWVSNKKGKNQGDEIEGQAQGVESMENENENFHRFKTIHLKTTGKLSASWTNGSI